ncbi:enoyl-CoA hydratase/isomerase family protein [Mycobacterium sp. SM1]|nr:enoyl-CoA hydratase/isomerase family protein [Mycobacterium sp. SM1]
MPTARNALTPAMYVGVRYAIARVNAEQDLVGLSITGTGDVFASGGDMPRKSANPVVVSAVNRLCQGGGLQIAMCSDVAVVSDRATFRVPVSYRGIAPELELGAPRPAGGWPFATRPRSAFTDRRSACYPQSAAYPQRTGLARVFVPN